MESQAVNWSVSLPVQYPAFQARASHTRGSRVQSGAWVEVRTDMLAGEVTIIEPHLTGPTTLARA